MWSGWFFGKHLSMMCRNFLPRLVLTFELKGGLYPLRFLVHFLLFFRAFSCAGLYVNLWSYPLSFKSFLVRGNGFVKYFFAGCDAN